ncbi:MAG: ABC transporter permease [candidate division NC10 bacterium]|nr:ABC transporter permease [candidate division NC10 bacterium]
MFERVKHMLIKEFIQVLRDPRMKGVVFVAPIIQLLVFGYAVTTDVRNIAMAILDRDNSVLSREVAARFVRSGYFRVVAHLKTDGEIQAFIDEGKAQAILDMEKGFGAQIQAGRTAPLQIIVDGTDSNTAGILLQYARRIVEQCSREILLSQSLRSRGRVEPFARIELQTRAWFNENLESRNFYVPGVIAIIVTLVTLMLTSMAIVREKEIGTMEQILVTPITPAEFVLGKTAPFALIGLADVLLVTGVGVLWFAVPIRGSLLLLLFGTVLYLMSTLGIGLLISTVSRTQQQAMMTTFFFFMPAILLSGLMFPIANMPRGVQWLTYLNPMRYFLVIIRGIFLKGVGPAILWPQMAALAAMGIFTLWLSTRRFRKTLA